jgi:hypothetical protein
MLRIISEWILDIDEWLCACFVDWQKTSDLVNRTKLMHILKEPGPIPVAVRSKAWVCDSWLAGILVSNSAGAWTSASCERCVLSGRGLCVGLITCQGESYRVWCVWVWSWSLDNEEALATSGCCAMGGGGGGGGGGGYKKVTTGAKKIGPPPGIWIWGLKKNSTKVPQQLW